MRFVTNRFVFRKQMVQRKNSGIRKSQAVKEKKKKKNPNCGVAREEEKRKWDKRKRRVGKWVGGRDLFAWRVEWCGSPCGIEEERWFCLSIHLYKRINGQKLGMRTSFDYIWTLVCVCLQVCVPNPVFVLLLPRVRQLRIPCGNLWIIL